VDGCLRDLLRAVGENPVKEVLALPRAAAAMRETRRAEHECLRASHAGELAALVEAGGGPPRDELEAAAVRQATELRAAAYRAEAAAEAWRGHAEGAAVKLEWWDARLLAEQAPLFWAKTGGWCCERLRGGEELLDWARRGLTAADCEAMGAELRRAKAPQVRARSHPRFRNRDA
jgi:hypothetical protein